MGISSSIQHFEFFKTGATTSATINLLIVGPGSVPIPPTGWGAVETIIWETIPIFLKNNINVGLLNSQSYFQWRKAKKRKYDVILCHSDTHIRRIRRNWKKNQILAITHYGLAAQPKLWHKSYKKTFESFQMSDLIGCLNPEIYKKFSGLMPVEKLLNVVNGTTFDSNPSRKTKTSFVLLGKVESRKKQYELWEYAKAKKMDIHFIGPIEDDRVKEVIKRDTNARNSFLGPKTRDELSSLMPKYSCLILLSEGEADALVLYEAQIAGLEIISNSASIGNQDLSLPWIHIIEKESDLESVAKSISQKPIDPFLISKYAEENYRWEVRLQPIINAIRKLSANGE